MPRVRPSTGGPLRPGGGNAGGRAAWVAGRQIHSGAHPFAVRFFFKKQIDLSSNMKTFKLPCFRSNLFYDIRFRDCLDEPYENLKDFIVDSLA